MDANWGLGSDFRGGVYPHESTIANRFPKKAPPAFDLSQPGSEAPGADPSLRPENDAAVVHRPQRTLADWHGPCTSTIVPDRGITPGRFPRPTGNSLHMSSDHSTRRGRQTLPGVFFAPRRPRPPATLGPSRPRSPASASAWWHWSRSRSHSPHGDMASAAAQDVAGSTAVRPIMIS